MKVKGLAGLTLLFAATPAHAGGVRIIDAIGNRNFPTIQAAVDAAVDGDILLVGEGIYGSVTVISKGLAIIAAPDADVRIHGTVVISGLTSQNIVLSGITVESFSSAPAIDVLSSTGHVRIQDCSIRGYSNENEGGHGGTALRVVSSDKVALVESSVVGGAGAESFTVDGGDGGNGADITGSTVFLDHCTVHGGSGANGDNGGDGGDAVVAKDVVFYASGSLLRGGDAGFGYYPAQSGSEGCGARFSAAAKVELLEVQSWSGFSYWTPGGVYACLQAPPGSVTNHPGKSLRSRGSRVTPDGMPWSLTIDQAAGSDIRVFMSRSFAFLPIPGTCIVWMLPIPMLYPSVPLATLPASGSGTFMLGLPPLPPSQVRARLFLQVLATNGSNAFAGGPMHLYILNPDSRPDCNGNGIQDYYEVVAGLTPDGNHNLVPDACEPGPVWYVDASAPPGGNGSATNPFRTIGEGMALAGSGQEVRVADGIYSGPGNRDLDFLGRDIQVVSENGPDNCIIDCQGAGRAFKLQNGESPSARIAGFTILNGRGSPSGGAVFLNGAGATIEDCRFAGCNAPLGDGGAIFLNASPARIRGCKFTGNSARVWGGAVAWYGASPAHVESSWFEGNAASGGGAIRVDSGRVSHCIIIENEAKGNATIGWGGGIFGSSDVDNCLIAGNLAHRGGGVSFLYAKLTINNSTIVYNTASQEGGGIYRTYYDDTISNTIVRGNQAPTGTQMYLAPLVAGKTIQVTYCNSQGGLSGVTVAGPLINLLWGPGNIDVDPLFVDPDGPDNDPLTFHDNDYRLGALSPCVDAGNNSLVLPDLFDLDGDLNTTEPVPFDLDLLPRFVDDLQVPNTGVGTPPVDIGSYERQP